MHRTDVQLHSTYSQANTVLKIFTITFAKRMLDWWNWR